MEEASPSGPSCCSRDRKGKQGEERMSSENEVSILIRVLKLICSSSSCGNAFKTFLYLKLQMAIDIFGMNKTDNLRIFPLFNLYTYAKLPYMHIEPYCSTTINGRLSLQTCGRFVHLL